MKAAIFSTKYYEREYLNKFNLDEKHELTFFDISLNAVNTNFSIGYDAFC